jgi:repressor LexA
MSSLSPKQLEVLEFISLFVEKRGLPPTRGEIAAGLGLKNRQGIDQHLRALETKGAIELVPGISRGIRLTRAEKHRSLLSDAHRQSYATTPSTLPLLGRIAAGSPILASENIEEEVHVDPAMFRPHADFLLRVRGDSMKDANILDRDLLAVHRINEAQNGQIVVARIGDEATVKYYRQEGHRIRLEPANSEYQPIEVDVRNEEFAIEGLAVGVIRRDLDFGTRG